MKEIIRIKDLSLTLSSQAGVVNILNSVSLKIKEGETVSIVGPSGAGKTSLIMLLSGLEKASSGSITVFNNNITSMTEDDLARFRLQNVGIVFQNYYLIPSLNALDNVLIPLELGEVEDAKAMAMKALDAVGLKNRYYHLPSQLSGGEQQRVAIARAFSLKPKIILADEPTGNLDSENGKAIIDLLFQLNAENKTTLLLITHDSKIAKRCKKHIEILDGKIVHANK